MISSLTLGKYTEPEKLETENKAFHLYNDSLSNFDDDALYDLSTIGKWNSKFEENVENSLIEFIYSIIPKYVSCFTNANINGILKIGVDDSSEITGIPYLKEIPKKKIEEIIKKALSENVKSEISSENLFEMIELEYVDLKIDKTILNDDAENYFKKFSNEILTYNDKMDEYLTEHSKFLVNHRQYTQKLALMLNKTKYRIELIEYIKSKSDKVNHLIELLESGDFIKLKKDNIYEDRENINRIFYWIAKFRDMKTAIICKNKPVKPLNPSIYHFRQIVSNLPAMRYKFISVNENIKYYMINIKFNVSNLKDFIYFKDKFNNKWQYRRRIESEEKYGPGCI